MISLKLNQKIFFIKLLNKVKTHRLTKDNNNHNNGKNSFSHNIECKIDIMEQKQICFENKMKKKQQHRIRTAKKFREKKSENIILLKTECKKISVRYYLKEIKKKNVTKQL